MRKRIFVVLIMCITIALLGVQLVVSHRLSTVGSELNKLQEETARLTLENELLKAHIASNSSMMAVTKRAKDLGFVSARYLYLSKSPVALK